MADKGKCKVLGRSPYLSPQEGQEEMPSLEDIAALGTTPEEYEQDRLARQSIAQKALDEILSASFETSTSRPSAQFSLSISQEDYEGHRQLGEAPARPPSLPAPPSVPPAGRSRSVRSSINPPGRLAALHKRLCHAATPRVRLHKDPFGVLESSTIRETQRQNFKSPMSSVAEQLEDVAEAELNLRQRALASSEPNVQTHDELSPRYDESPMIFYQVRARPFAQLPAGCPHGDWHNNSGPKFGILELLKETMVLLGVNWDFVQDLEDNDGFFFALEKSRGAPFQTPGWQSLVEVRRLNAEDDRWDIVTPVEERRLVQKAKARFMSRLASSDAENENSALSTNVLGDVINENVAGNSKQGTSKNTNHGAASLLDVVNDKLLEDVDRKVTISEYEVHSECS